VIWWKHNWRARQRLRVFSRVAVGEQAGGEADPGKAKMLVG